MKLVESINEAALNAQAFSGIEEMKDSTVYRRFSQFFHWYYFSNLGIFAPSKFIGYKDTTITNYPDMSDEKHGSKTQDVLCQWFIKVEPDTEKFNELKEKLAAFAASIGKTISTKTFEGTGGIYVLSEEYSGSDFPDELSNTDIMEGEARQVMVSTYERNPKARAECIAHYGAKCSVCDFEFHNIYGKALGTGFIHVHHILDIALIGKKYKIDPIQDLRPVCPNCHAMLHKRKPAMHPDDLREIIREQTVAIW